jgi:hypothetical protein
VSVINPLKQQSELSSDAQTRRQVLVVDRGSEPSASPSGRPSESQYCTLAMSLVEAGCLQVLSSAWPSDLVFLRGTVRVLVR